MSEAVRRPEPVAEERLRISCSEFIRLYLHEMAV